ncbi:MAG TPA: AAA family ATPase, partial [Nocardioides sp.]|nr:AAA family ATPase [Nocardioides sp.]
MPQGPGGTRRLIGRDRECSLLTELVAGKAPVPVAVVRGEAGMGKTALLRWTAEMARVDGRTVQAAGTPAESDLPFAGLHQLLRPVLEEAGATPRSQVVTEALEAHEAAGAALFRTAMAVLELLTEVSSGERLLIVADDVQWLDRPSRDVLTFVARRLGVDPVGMVLAAREPAPADLEQAAIGAGWLRLELAALTEEDSAALLDEVAPDLAPDVRRRVLAEAAGNPLALSELPQSMPDVVPSSTPGLLPLTARLEAAFASRLPGLPEPSRWLALVAAAHDSDDLAEVLEGGAARGQDVGLRDLEPVVGAGLVLVEGGRVRFRHPLARAAVYQSAGPVDRQAAHRALARTSRSPDRRARHAAAAAEGPDETVAEQLDAVAERAGHSGASETSVNALEAAARVSDDPGRRALRLLRAVELAQDLGQRERALRLLADLDAGALDHAGRVRLDWLRELMTEGAWSGGDRVASFTAIAARMGESGDVERAVEMLVGIALRCWWSNLDLATRTTVAETADQLRTGPDDPFHLAVTALAAPVERGRDVLAALGRVAVPELYPNAGLLMLLGLAATAVGDQPRGVTMYSAAVAESRRQGRTGVLSQALSGLAWAETHVGRLGRVDVVAEEAIRLCAETGQPLWRATTELALAAARGLRGDETNAETLTRSAEGVFLGTGANPMLALVQAARGFAALGAGRHDDAYAQLARAFTARDAAFHQYFRH